MKRAITFINIVLGVLVVSIAIVLYSSVKFAPEIGIAPTDYGEVLDVEEYEDHKYTLLEVVTGLSDKAHFLGLYVDLDSPDSSQNTEGAPKHEDEAMRFNVNTADALWLQYDDDIRSAELDLRIPSVTVIHNNSDSEIYELPGDILSL